MQYHTDLTQFSLYAVSYRFNPIFPVCRADVIRQKSEAVRNLASQLIEEHEDYAR
jgi:hypothetical protein